MAEQTITNDTAATTTDTAPVTNTDTTAPVIRKGNSAAFASSNGTTTADKVEPKRGSEQDTVTGKQDAPPAAPATDVTAVAPPAAPATNPPAAEPHKPAEQEAEPDLKTELETLRKEKAERERKELAEKQVTLNNQQQAHLNKLQVTIKQTEAMTATLYDDYVKMYNAYAEEPTPEAAQATNQVYNQYIASQEAETTLKDTFNNTLKGYRENYTRTRLNEQETIINDLAKEAGTTLADLKKANDKLDITQPAAVIKALLKSQKDTLQAEISGLKKQLADAEEKYRAKWDATSPAAVPPTGTATSTATANEFVIKRGNGADLLRKGLETTSRRR